MLNRLYKPIVAIGFAALTLLLIAGPGTQLEFWGFRTAFTIMRFGAYGGLASMLLALTYVMYMGTKGRPFWILFISGLAGLVAVYVPYQQLQTARSVPAIHDISTDLINPPAFVDVTPLRAKATNSVEYAGEAVAEMQRAAYPGIETLRVKADIESVFSAILSVVNKLDWALVAADEPSGRIEATETTMWFGFKDDVVIRVRNEEEFVAVDVRSKSRVGISDLGVNAARIRRFMGELEVELGR